jgi:hypothetical protein
MQAQITEAPDFKVRLVDDDGDSQITSVGSFLNANLSFMGALEAEAIRRLAPGASYRLGTMGWSCVVTRL